MSAYLDAIDVMLNGVYFTIEAALPAMLAQNEGGAIVITSSAAGLESIGRSFDTREHGLAGYTAAKHGVVGLMRYFATVLAEKKIRVNSVHPTGVATPMIQNEAVERYADEHPAFANAFENLLPVPVIDPQD
jgi:NAD(P)-dependent dehydrogenase (short-subunit alcohol dehydrogenase family)